MQDLIIYLEDATQTLPGRITPDTTLRTMEGWDSLGVVNFITVVAEHYPIELAADDLKECVTVADLHAMLVRKTEQLAGNAAA